ncbi:MAG: DNA polymerase (family 10), partial [Bradymonadia bacterium]
MNNDGYASLLEEFGDLLQVVGANGFKVRAFQRAARAISGLPSSIEEAIAAGTTTDIDGIGKSIAADLAQIKERGSCDALDQLRAELPDDITELLKIQGLGPKKVGKIYTELGIGDIDTLELAAQEGRLAALAGFGAKTEEKILKEIERLRKFTGRTPFAEAWPLAHAMLEQLRSLAEVERAEIAGSLRRRRETVGDLDFVVASNTPGPVMDAFATGPGVTEVVVKGETKTTVYIGRVSADLRVVPPEVFGATLHHFTGSKEHNIEMRARALKRGLRVSEWGVFRRTEASMGAGPTEVEEELVACHSEEDIFAAVGLPFVPPELREGRGEIAAAEAGELPTLIAVHDIVGDLHMHTT